MTKQNPQDVINSFQKRQKFTPYLIGGLAVLLVVVGIVVLVIWLTGSGAPGFLSRATETPTPTNTFTPSPIPPTSTPTMPPTATLTPEPSLTPTPSGPFEYTVQENDNCWGIAEQFDVDIIVLLALNNFGGSCPIQPGDKILIPAPDTQLPTETPLPTDLAYGTKIEYTIKSGDSLDGIASKFNTTVDAIIEENELEDANTIFAGQVLIIKANIVTPTPTLPPTSTPAVQTAYP